MLGLRSSHAVYLVSVGFHLGLGAILAAVHVAGPAEVVNVEVQTFEREKPKPKPEPKPEPVAQPVPRKAAPAPDPVAAPPPAPDYGFALGPSDGPGGIAVPAPPPPPVHQAVVKKLGTIAPAEVCTEPDTKPKPISAGKPAYTEAALAAGVKGKVRVEITVDPTGAVVGARVVEGLGYGLDEAAVAAAHDWKFTPATHCGKPVATTLVVGLNFG